MAVLPGRQEILDPSAAAPDSLHSQRSGFLGTKTKCLNEQLGVTLGTLENTASKTI